MKQELKDKVRKTVERVSQLEQQGYTLLNDPTADFRSIVHHGDSTNINDIQDEVLEHLGIKKEMCSCGDGNRAVLGHQCGYAVVSAIGHDIVSEDRSVADLKDDRGNSIGTPGVGYIKWGGDDRLPMHVFHAVASQIYTATAERFLQDAVYGKGPKFMYRIVRYVNGMIQEDHINFDDAGTYLEGEIRKLREEMQQANTTEPSVNDDETTSGYLASIGQKHEGALEYRVAAPPPAPAPSSSVNHDALGSADSQLQALYEEYDKWLDTKKELDTFLERTNINDIYRKCMTDDQMTDQYCILMQIEQGKSKSWTNPKVIALEHRPILCCRKEKMDERMRINYIYFSDAWRHHRACMLDEKNVVAFPTLRQDSIIRDLKDYVSANQSTPVAKRKVWHAVWNQQDCGYEPYYQRPSWWSIFSSLVFQYVSTFIFDKTIERKNANMASHLIYINDNYMKAYYEQMGANDLEKKRKLRSELVASIDRFLKDKSNNGKSITLSNFIAPDGKTIIKSIEIVAVPKAESGATREDLTECANLIFWTMGIHSNLIGSFDKNASTGGTQQRELYLLKQVMLSPRQQRFVDMMNSIFRYNGWTDHLCLHIGREVLTTLDASKTGITEE